MGGGGGGGGGVFFVFDFFFFFFFFNREVLFVGSLTFAFFSKPYVTEVDLRHSLIPDDLVEDLLASMPEHKGPDLQEDRDKAKYDYAAFMESMTLGGISGAADTEVVNGNGG